MIIRVFAIPIVFVCLSTTASAAEITDTEWKHGDLVVRAASAVGQRVSCTAYNAQGRPIGGALSYAWGGVAKVHLDVPSKYKGMDLQVRCK